MIRFVSGSPVLAFDCPRERDGRVLLDAECGSGLSPEAVLSDVTTSYDKEGLCP